MIEHISGVLKRQFRILLLAPEYDMDLQARIPPALCALHNFICCHDSSDINDYADMNHLGVSHLWADDPEIGDLAMHALTSADRESADAKWEQIAKAMWDEYQHVVHE